MRTKILTTIAILTLLILMTGCNTGVKLSDKIEANVTYNIEIYEGDKLINHIIQEVKWETEVTEECFPYEEIPQFKAAQNITIKEGQTVNLYLGFELVSMPKSEREGESVCFQEYYKTLKKYNAWREIERINNI